MELGKLTEELGRILSQLKESLFSFLPKLILACAILLIGILIARLVRTIINRLVNRLDRFVPGQKVKARVRTFLTEKPVARVLGSLVYWMLVILFLTIATETLGLPIVTTWLSGIAGYLPKILTALLIAIVALIGGSLLRDLVTTTASSARIAYGNVLGRLVQIIVIVISILIAFDQLGIEVTLLSGVVLISIGALLFSTALAFGLGARTSVSNILASYYLQKTYKIGDTVEIGDRKGRIIQITSISVLLESSEGKICVPAQKFNESASVLLAKEG